MWLGSPSSPSSPTGQRLQTPYLPPYLMGESLYSLPVTPNAKSATKNVSPTARSSIGRTPAGRSAYLGNSRTSFYEKEAENRPARRRYGPPPVKMLDESFSNSNSVNPASNRMDEVDCPDLTENSFGLSASFNQSHSKTGMGIFGNQSVTRDPSASNMTYSFLKGQQIMSPSPAQLDPFYTQGESLNLGDELDETWVTVFGFPQSTESFILQEFAYFGTILNHVVPSEGNWMHIQFQNKLQAKRALSKSGKIFGGTIMVGVTQCIDKLVMNGKRPSLRASTSHGNLLNGSQANNLLTPNTSQMKTPMRPLTSGYKVPFGDQVNETAPVPQRSSGLVSKAMEYVFGW